MTNVDVAPARYLTLCEEDHRTDDEHCDSDQESDEGIRSPHGATDEIVGVKKVVGQIPASNWVADENRHIGKQDPSSSLPRREQWIDRQQDETQDHGRIGVSYVLYEE